MTVYKREGDTPEKAWNELIRQVNELVEECSGVDPLEEVDENTLWYKSHPSKTMIQQVQDKLVEVCEDNEFDDIPNLWKQSLIDEMVEAIEEGQCCCEQEDVELDSPNVIWRSGSSDLGPTLNLFDWANRVMEERNGPLTVETVECPTEDDEEPIEVEIRTGGKGFVGREFTDWEMYFLNDNTGFDVDANEPIASGDVVDGYIDIGEGEYLPLATCENPDLEPGTPLGTTDPNWGFPYTSEFGQLVGGQLVVPHKIIANDGETLSFDGNLNEDSFIMSRPTSPYTFRVAEDVSNTTILFDLKFVLRLKCDTNE